MSKIIIEGELSNWIGISIYKHVKNINITNISYIMSYMTCEYKHNAIKPPIPNQSINLEVLDSHAYINSSTTKFRTFLT